MELSLSINRATGATVVTTLPGDSIDWEDITGRSSFEMAEKFGRKDVWLFAYIAESRDLVDRPSFNEWRKGVHDVTIEESKASGPTEPDPSAESQ